ncbi:unnamed protein product [Mytilus edulis]|uniref:Uncharacterized protein n=1 Tax=Mytilus edulis TaxID=6550 RepID=A0A8S3QS07_MYTED|nr:unnamed protein product [Mytilus edulis]
MTVHQLKVTEKTNVYNDGCEFLSYIACPQAAIDLGFTCRCPIDPVHLVMNYHSRRSNISSLPPLQVLGPFFSGLDFIFAGVSNVLSGRFEVKENPSGFNFFATPWRYKLSPPSKRTKPSGSNPVVKYTSQRSPHLFKKSISPIKTSTPIYIRRNLFTQNHEIFETKKADIQYLLFTNIDESQDNLEEDHKEEHVLDNEEVIEEDHVVDHEKDHMEDLEEEYKVFKVL